MTTPAKSFLRKKKLPLFSPGEKAYSRYGVPIIVLEWPVVWPHGVVTVKVRLPNEHHDVCYWAPDQVVKQGQTIPLFPGAL